MNCKIIQMSDLTLHILKTKQNGYVHSVYRKTININLGGVLLALQAFQSPLSPISLLTELNEDSMKKLNIQAGAPVKITESSVMIESLCFSFRSAEIIPTELKKSLPLSCIQKLKEHLETVIFSSHTGGFDTIFHNYRDASIPLPSLILESARSFLSKAYYSILSEDYTSASLSLCHLIGLGTGLTPSGDDFLCGVLAGLTLSGKENCTLANILKKDIAKHLSNTNDISQAFLHCALQNRFSLAVNSLAELPDAFSIRSSFEKIGHSSGIDTLCGIFFILNV